MRRIRPCDLRHTNATELRASGGGYKAVHARLGHTYPAFTLRVYAHAIEEMDTLCAQLLAERRARIRAEVAV